MRIVPCSLIMQPHAVGSLQAPTRIHNRTEPSWQTRHQRCSSAADQHPTPPQWPGRDRSSDWLARRLSRSIAVIPVHGALVEPALALSPSQVRLGLRLVDISRHSIQQRVLAGLYSVNHVLGRLRRSRRPKARGQRSVGASATWQRKLCICANGLRLP